MFPPGAEANIWGKTAGEGELGLYRLLPTFPRVAMWPLSRALLRSS